jgi:hypothetical protein
MNLTANLITYICNPALVGIGARILTGITDTSNEADLCKAMYELVRNAELRERIWNCTRKQLPIDVEATEPVYDWSYKYAIPEDCLYIIELEGDKDFTVKSRFIYTDEKNSDDQINIEYVQRADTTYTAWVTSTLYSAGAYVIQSSMNYKCLVSHTSGTFATDLAAGKWEISTIDDIDTEIARFDSSLKTVLAARLGAVLSKSLTKHKTEQDQAWQLYDFMLDKAFIANAYEDRHGIENGREDESSWITSRRG